MKATGTSFKTERPHREGAKAAKKIFAPFVMSQDRSDAFRGVLSVFTVPALRFRFTVGRGREMGCLAILLLSSLLVGMDTAVPEAEERKQLGEKEAQLEARIASLKREQDFLLFQKDFFSSDSKYLVLDLAAGTGTLKYRNRTLRTFSITISPKVRNGLGEGRYLLTAKTDGLPQQRTLVFQDAFIVREKGSSGASPADKRLPNIVIGRKDLAAIFYAVDRGSMVYLR